MKKNKLLHSVTAAICAVSVLISSASAVFAADWEDIGSDIYNTVVSTDNDVQNDNGEKPIPVVVTDENGCEITDLGGGYFEKRYYDPDTGKIETETYFDETVIDKESEIEENDDNIYDGVEYITDSNAPVSVFNADNFFELSSLDTNIYQTTIEKDGDGEDDSTVYYGDCTGDGTNVLGNSLYGVSTADPELRRMEGDKVEWWLDSDGTLTFKGQGCIANYSGSTAPWNANVRVPYPVKNIVIEEGIRFIGNYAFKDLQEIESVKYPEKSLLGIGWNAFDNTSIHEFNVPDSVKFIDVAAFKDCKNLLSVKYDTPEDEAKEKRTLKLPSSLIFLGSSAFINDIYSQCSISFNIKSC